MKKPKKIFPPQVASAVAIIKSSEQNKGGIWLRGYDLQLNSELDPAGYVLSS